MKTILIVEDDPAILKGLEAALLEDHYHVLTAADGEKGLTMARREKADLIILDVMLPKMDGFEVCRQLRGSGADVPVLFLTSRKEEIDRVLGLELGADDYMTKPFSVRELKARIKARLRRTTEIRRELEEYSFGNVYIDFRKHEVTRGSKPLKLSAKELEVLKYFIQREGEVITRDALLDDVWGYDTFPTTRTVDNYILTIRKKIEKDPSRPEHLITVHSAGYKFTK
ncbi:MAG TPA: response regulator transcription factor [Bacteroidota bacterium]|nr:response regulator transcription factor [Bacteroidota bacterium]